jgi:hypothetical protein
MCLRTTHTKTVGHLSSSDPNSVLNSCTETHGLLRQIVHFILDVKPNEC